MENSFIIYIFRNSDILNLFMTSYPQIGAKGTSSSGVPGGEKKMISTSTQTEDNPETRRSQAKECYTHEPEIDSDTDADSD